MPKADHPPAFPFYPDDFISDSAVDAMTSQEVGIYVRLLCKAWKEEPVGTLPNDDQLLSRWAKETPAAWKKCKPGVLRAFRIEGDRLHQKRMMETWQKVIENREAKSRAGKKGMSNRWQNDNTAITDDITKNNFPPPPPIPIPTSISNTVQTGAKDFVFGEGIDGIRERAVRIQTRTRINCKDDGNRKLVAKVAVLWDSHEFSDEEIECVLESFDRGGNIRSRVGYLRGALAKRCEERRVDFNALLDRTIVPIALMMPTGASA